ncbi:endonuclease/exonuclease/phosphatase family protein [Pedobacter cryoconitis]|uniref:Endonuclease/exonuclease/phosphatase family metal-dependent hydrolase n=1 Tax=Pedobacter cryoconitis TaxID=188932 RepID=A0A7X0MJZ0_9SPHI|nr:endonuclease/exonuclease/phosphatase family protein [Pedobacter cryoconitis]MBB6499953.1 endonuclease/exonuclease/phosphatase family metal-dependent hydrolase [Pedobacter cryoconitis]
MKRYIITVFLLFSFSVFGQTLTVCSWNLKDFGKSKTDTQIDFIAQTLKNCDIVAVQEVVAGPGGPQAVARLSDALNRTGTKWDYTISHGTSSDRYSKERYAFIWKTSRTEKIGEAWLEKKYNLEITREPYFARFRLGKKQFTLVTMHAIPKSKQPETEIKYLKYFPESYPSDVLIFCGDFNLPESHSVWNPLKNAGYPPAFTGQKTSLKQRCVNGNCLASAYDNFFYNQAKVNLIDAGIIPFYAAFEDLKEARKLSDHVPVFLKFSMI